jgi:hypothetical protein
VKIGEDIMKNKLILKIVIALFVGIVLISCDKVKSLTEHNVLLASGVTFNSGSKKLEDSKFIVISSINGKVVESCNKTEIIEEDNLTVEKANKSNQSSTKTPLDKQCNNQVVTTNPELLNALRIKNPTDGFVIKDGKRVPAKIFISATMVYLGSHCESISQDGDTYTKCVAGDF